MQKSLKPCQRATDSGLIYFNKGVFTHAIASSHARSAGVLIFPPIRLEVPTLCDNLGQMAILLCATVFSGPLWFRCAARRATHLSMLVDQVAKKRRKKRSVLVFLFRLCFISQAPFGDTGTARSLIAPVLGIMPLLCSPGMN